MYHQMLCTESDRNILTKYRTGSHSLRIHTGRKNNEDRTERLCLCNDDIQTIDHILFHCKVTKNIRNLIDKEDNDFENTNYSHTSSILRSMEHTLHIKNRVRINYLSNVFYSEICIWYFLHK